MTKRLRAEQLERYGFGPEIMQKTKICPCCSGLVTNGENICPVCGRALPGLTLFAWYMQQHEVCSSCGTVVSGDGSYCPHCGKLLRKPNGTEQ